MGGLNERMGMFGGLAQQPLRRRVTMTEHYPTPPLQFPPTVDGGHNFGTGMTLMPHGFGPGIGGPSGPRIRSFPTAVNDTFSAGGLMPSAGSPTLAGLGRYGDTMLAHVNPEEGQVLKAMGGSGTINPETGLREYFDTSNMPRSQNVTDARVTGDPPFQHSQAPQPNEKDLQNLQAGITDPQGYERFGLTAPQIPEHMIDPLLNSIHTMEPQQVRLAAPALMGALIKRHMKMASMQRFQPPQLPLPQPLPQPQPQRRQRSSIQPRGYGGIRG